MLVPSPESRAAAARIQRRMQTKNRYRRNRDRKIPVDWLGREFILLQKSELTGNDEQLHLRLTAYNPDQHTIVFTPTRGEVGSVTWMTDMFWQWMRRGRLIPD